ncbi:hypothetical protein ACFL0I_00065 [Gemmatimonadota bacterium]
MPPPRSVTGVALALLLAQTTGCYSFRPLESELPTTRSAAEEGPIVRVTSRNGETEELIRAWMDSVAVQGDSRWRSWGYEPERVIVPLSEVQRIEERHFDPIKTLIRIAVTPVIAWLLLGWALASG